MHIYIKIYVCVYACMYNRNIFRIRTHKFFFFVEKAYRSINENAELLFLPWFWVSANILCVNPALLSSAKYPSVLAFVLFVISPGFLCILKRMFLCRQYWHCCQCIFSGRSGTVFVLPNLRSVRQEPKLPTVSLTLLRKWREIRLASVNNFMSLLMDWDQRACRLKCSFVHLT